MASSAGYIAFVLDTLRRFGDVRAKKMFGDYVVYLCDKPILTVCDNTVYVKMLPELAELLSDAEQGCPYDGAKMHYIPDIEDAALLARLIPQLLELVKPKARKK